jgi:uncharacterized membrane protein
MDLLRGLAVVAMIGVHTVNALLDPALRQGALSAVVHFASGLVAPAFLLVAGFTFLLGNAPQGAGRWAFRSRLPRVLGRIGLIWLVGYLLHLPAYTLSDWRVRVGALQWQEFFGVDVLHCIGVGLLVLLVLRLVVPGGRALLGAVVLAGCLAVLLAGPVWQAESMARLPLWLSGYLAPSGTTLFPLLPWFGFLAAGAALSLLWTRARAAGQEERFQQVLLRTGLALALPGLALLVLVRDHLHLLVDERPSVIFFLCRLGFVLLLVAAGLRACRGRAALAPLIAWPAREALLFYVLHLKLLYHPLPGGRSLVELLGPHLGYPGCVAVAGALFLVTLVPAVLWHRLKSLHPQAGPRLVQAFLGLGLVVFVCG